MDGSSEDGVKCPREQGAYTPLTELDLFRESMNMQQEKIVVMHSCSETLSLLYAHPIINCFAAVEYH